MRISANLTYISLTVLGVFGGQSALANATTADETLDEIVVSDRQGTKVATNIVTLEEKNEHTATDLRSLLSKEPSIDLVAAMVHLSS